MNQKHIQKHTNTPHQQPPESKRNGAAPEVGTGPTHTLVGVREVHFLGGWLTRRVFIILPTQTKPCIIRMEILQNYHTFALFHSQNG